MTAEQYLAWAALAQQLVALGVRSFAVVRALLADAGVEADDARLAELEGLWAALRADVARAAGPDPT